MYEPPTDEQLEGFVTVRCFGPWVSDGTRALVRSALRSPAVRAGWLERHRELQTALWEVADRG